MSLSYIRDYYGVPAKRGARVVYSSGPRHGTITGTRGAHLMIRLDGEKRSRPYHPTWNLQYVGEPKEAK